MVKLSAPYPRGDALERTASSAIRDLLEITELPGVISLAGGLPTPEAFPVEAIKRATGTVLASEAHTALQYSATEGYRPLREWVAARALAEAEQVIITHGSQQALDLLARATVRDGDSVVLADPGYIGAIQAFRGAGAALVGVSSDSEGLCVDDLEERLRHGLRPTLVYVVANFDNPTGSTLSEHRRSALAGMADHFGFVIVEDDPYGELRWHGSAGTPLRLLTDRCISLGTVSKILSPGLRVGWAVGPPEIIRAMVVLKQASDLHTSSFAQHVVHHVLTEPGFLPAHLAGLRLRYQHQATVLVLALQRSLGDRLSFEEPEGGMFVWGQLLDPSVDATALLPLAVVQGMAFVPGSAFAVSGNHRSNLRLSFATGTPDQLTEGVARLGAALAAHEVGGAD